MSQAPQLLVHDDGPIVICTLNRPEKLNALTREMWSTYESALHRFRDTPELKVLLIQATGRYFSAGVDQFQGGGEQAPYKMGSSVRESHRLQSGMQRILDEMEHIEKPIVVAHHATCVGGGLELSLSCDFRLAAKSARYSFPENKMGILPASNGVSRLTRICGTHWARYMVMANKIVDADRALMMGLVHEVFPDDTFQEDVMAFCRHLAAQSLEQMGGAKIAIELARDVGPDQARHVERMMNSALMLSSHYIEMRDAHHKTIGHRRQS